MTEAPPSTNDRPVGIDVPTAGFIGITVAAGIATALAYARAHQRRRARTGDLTAVDPAALPKVVTAAQNAHLRAQRREVSPYDENEFELTPQEPAAVSAPPLHRVPPPAAALPPGQITIGVRGPEELTVWEAVGDHGLGLTGPGATAAARAILVSALTAAERERPDRPDIAVVLTQAAEARIHPAPDQPDLLAALPTLNRVDTTDDALARIDQHLIDLVRYTENADSGPPSPIEAPPSQLVVLTESDNETRPQLAAAAKHGRTQNVAVVVLGTWPHACTIEFDGEVTSARGTPRQKLKGSRLFVLPRDQFHDVIELTKQAHGSQPGTHGTPRFASPEPTTAEQPEDQDVEPPHAELPRTVPIGIDTVPEKPITPTDIPRVPTTAVAAPTITPPTPIYLHVLGMFRIDVAHHPTRAGTKSGDDTREFLTLLAAHPTGLRMEEIAEALQLPPGDRLAHDLARVRRAARRVLRDATEARGNPTVLLHDGDRLRLNPTCVTTDVALFLDALDRAARTTGTQRVTALDEALSVYGGKFAEGTDYAWADLTRENLHRRAVDACVLLAEALADDGLTDLALAKYEQAIDWDPTNESLYQQVIKLQLAAHRPDAARRTFEALRTRLREIDAEPDRATTRLLHGD